jgi:hypothetical protein
MNETAMLHFALGHLLPDQAFTLHAGPRHYEVTPQLETPLRGRAGPTPPSAGFPTMRSRISLTRCSFLATRRCCCG